MATNFSKILHVGLGTARLECVL